MEPWEEEYEAWVRENYEEWHGIYVHNRTRCQGETCPIHNPSIHHMVDWPQHFRLDRGIMERTCEHGVGHPDPDDRTEDTTHGCDGCCTPEGHYGC